MPWVVLGVTLVQLLEQWSISTTSIALAKLDIEGSELDALEGVLLQTGRLPQLIIELGPVEFWGTLQTSMVWAVGNTIMWLSVCSLHAGRATVGPALFTDSPASAETLIQSMANKGVDLLQQVARVGNYEIRWLLSTTGADVHRHSGVVSGRASDNPFSRALLPLILLLDAIPCCSCSFSP